MENSCSAVFFSALWICHLIDFLPLFHFYEKLAVCFTENPLYVMNLLYFAVFKILRLSTVILWCLCKDLFQFILLGICWDTWMFLINIRNKFGLYFLKILFLCLYLFFLLQVLPLCICLYAWWWPTSLLDSIFLLFLRLDFLNWSIFNFTDSLFCQLKNTIKHLS